MIDVLQEEDKKFLLKVARDAIWSKLVNEELPVYYKDKELYSEKTGVIIKLKINERLRGYVAKIEPETGLLETIQQIAIHSAFYEPRFIPLKKDEYEKLSIEIFIIKEVNELKDFKAINPQKDGIMIKNEFTIGLLLPDDFLEFGLTPEEYVKEATLRAGLSQDTGNIQYFAVDFIKIEE